VQNGKNFFIADLGIFGHQANEHVTLEGLEKDMRHSHIFLTFAFCYITALFLFSSSRRFFLFGSPAIVYSVTLLWLSIPLDYQTQHS
jgi:hypothetical protein